MSFDKTTTFILKDKTYILHDFVMKKSPILKELSKSSNIETLIYEPEIDYSNINYAFCILYGDYTRSKITIDSFVAIYEFIIYLCLDATVIKAFICSYVNDFIMDELVEYGIKNNCVYEFFDMVFEHFNRMCFDLNLMKQVQFDAKCKRKWIDKILLDKVGKAIDGVTTYNTNLLDRLFYKYKYQVTSVYNNILHVHISCGTIRENGIPIYFMVNGKEIHIIEGNNAVPDAKIKEIYLKDTILNHMAMVVLGEVEL